MCFNLLWFSFSWSYQFGSTNLSFETEMHTTMSERQKHIKSFSLYTCRYFWWKSSSYHISVCTFIKYSMRFSTIISIPQNSMDYFERFNVTWNCNWIYWKTAKWYHETETETENWCSAMLFSNFEWWNPNFLVLFSSLDFEQERIEWKTNKYIMKWEK